MNKYKFLKIDFNNSIDFKNSRTTILFDYSILILNECNTFISIVKDSFSFSLDSTLLKNHIIENVISCKFKYFTCNHVDNTKELTSVFNYLRFIRDIYYDLKIVIVSSPGFSNITNYMQIINQNYERNLTASIFSSNRKCVRKLHKLKSRIICAIRNIKVNTFTLLHEMYSNNNVNFLIKQCVNSITLNKNIIIVLPSAIFRNIRDSIFKRIIRYIVELNHYILIVKVKLAYLFLCPIIFRKLIRNLIYSIIYAKGQFKQSNCSARIVFYQ